MSIILNSDVSKVKKGGRNAKRITMDAFKKEVHQTKNTRKIMANYAIELASSSKMELDNNKKIVSMCLELL